MNKELNNKIPVDILHIVQALQSSGFEAQIVGGSVRDLIIGIQPKDWDINTNAKPEQILELFPDSFYENDFGTVGVKIRKDVLNTQHFAMATPQTQTKVTRETMESLDKYSDSDKDQQTMEVSRDTDTEVVEVTPYRKEGKYEDGRHPSSVSFEATLSDDLKRRDFTINSIAYDPIRNIVKDSSAEPIDLENTSDFENLESIKDISSKTIRAVGNPNERFQEDYLRMLRAVRLSAQLGFTIEKETEKAIIENSTKISKVSRERVRDELTKIFVSDTPMVGFLQLDYTGLLKDIIPELLLGKGMKQTENHKFDVYGHLLRSMQHAADKKYSLEMRITALLHDIAKPHTCKLNKQTGWNSFHGHEVVGEKVSREILMRLKFPQEMINKVCKLVRWHMFNSDPDQVTMSAVRRMIVNVGRENIWDLMNLRFCDRIGSGRPMEEPYRLRRYFAMIEEALTQPTDLKMLKIDGKKIMQVTRETPGPRIGLILNALMGEVLENPELNTEESLVSRVTEMSKLDNQTLKTMAEKGKEELEEVEKEKEKEIKRKFKV